MKYFVKTWMFYMVAIWLIKEWIPAFQVSGGWIYILYAGGILAFLMLLIRPIIKILFIPINFLTLGLVSWVVNVIVIYLLTLIAPNVTVVPWVYQGWSWQGFIIPATTIPYLATLILVTFALTFVTQFLEHITD
jgi:uncharacterized membrane protein YvlD (DUF360 family)